MQDKFTTLIAGKGGVERLYVFDNRRVVRAAILECYHPLNRWEVQKHLTFTAHLKARVRVSVGEKMLCFRIVQLPCLLIELPVFEKLRRMFAAVYERKWGSNAGRKMSR